MKRKKSTIWKTLIILQLCFGIFVLMQLSTEGDDVNSEKSNANIAYAGPDLIEFGTDSLTFAEIYQNGARLYYVDDEIVTKAEWEAYEAEQKKE